METNEENNKQQQQQQHQQQQAPRRISLRPQSNFTNNTFKPFDKEKENLTIASPFTSLLSGSGPQQQQQQQQQQQHPYSSTSAFNRTFNSTTSSFKPSKHVFRNDQPTNTPYPQHANKGSYFSSSSSTSFSSFTNSHASSSSSSSFSSSSSNSSKNSTYYQNNYNHQNKRKEDENENENHTSHSFDLLKDLVEDDEDGERSENRQFKPRGFIKEKKKIYNNQHGNGSFSSSQQSQSLLSSQSNNVSKYQPLPNLPYGTLSLYFLPRVDINIEDDDNFIANYSQKRTFSLSHIKTIMEIGFNYRLPLSVIDVLQEIHSQLLNDENAQLPVLTFKKSIVNMDNFDNLIAKSNAAISIKEEEKESLASSLRLLLNKLSVKNFNETKTNILLQIQNKMSGPTGGQREEIDASVELIFETVSSNKYYASLYANLFEEILRVFPRDYAGTIPKKLSEFYSSFQNIFVGNPDIDYDDFCFHKKINDKRKAISFFFLHLFQKNLILPNLYIDFITFLLSEITTHINEENQKEKIEQLAENLSYAYDKSNPLLVHTFGETIKQISKYKTKDYKSFSNKSMFSFLDMTQTSGGSGSGSGGKK